MVLQKLTMYDRIESRTSWILTEDALRRKGVCLIYDFFCLRLFFYIIEWTGDEPKKKKHRTKKKKSAKKRGQNALEGTGARSTDEKPKSERTEIEGNESDGSDEANDDMDDE